MPKVLFISTEFPPAAKSSGVQRILKFVQYLPALGWEPLVLTMHPMAYGESISHQPLSSLPKSLLVKRALAFNTSIHFAIKGRYLSWMALPDRWVSWVFFGFFSGVRFIKRYKPNVIVSSYPHASAHLLALLLHKVTKVPWVADFRDPMLYFNEDIQGVRYKIYQWLEAQTIKHCHCAVFTTPSAISQYAKVKFPDYPESKWHLIENGFDEAVFLDAELLLQKVAKHEGNKITLLHAGVLYPDERDPCCFFQAVANLLSSGVIKTGALQIILRAPGNELSYQIAINELGLQDIILIKPQLNYIEALAEMLSVDGLLVFQGANCNVQVPAKVYEYFRAKKPIFALTDSAGDTASLLRSAGIDNIAALDNAAQITALLGVFLQRLNLGEPSIATSSFVTAQSRKSRAVQLADVLSVCVKTGTQ